MSRLADYFIVVGYDHEKQRGGSSYGKVIQRFPEKDWDDCPCTQGIELFCQPQGWALSTERQQPTFFVAVLTDIDADRHYCACLTFNETIAMTPSKPDDVDGDEHEPTLVHHSLMFAPKSLVLVSRLNYFETFRNCLGIIYTAYVDKLDVQLETLVGNILGCVHVPPPGGPQVRFSIGAGDRQALQPPLSNTLPATKVSVAMLFKQLGIQNSLALFFLSITDHKILFHSQSYSRLTEACHALTSMQYPLKYNYVYIPILPAALLEVLSTPTPFIAGIHSFLTEDIFADLLDVIVVDLDGGNLRIPECVNLPMLSDEILKRVKTELTMTLNPDLLMADFAFHIPSPKKAPSLEQKDKEIRAIIIRMMCELFTGYRSCLTLIRIHPDPVITFHKANFLGHKGMVEDDFVVRVLDGMGFNSFVAERGPPYRVCDIFDEVYATMQDQLKEERENREKVVEHLKDLAHQLYVNENPNPQPYVQKVPKPTEGSHERIHQPLFPELRLTQVQEIVDEGIAKHGVKNKNRKVNLDNFFDFLQFTSQRATKLGRKEQDVESNYCPQSSMEEGDNAACPAHGVAQMRYQQISNVRPHQPRIVPMGPPITSLADRQRIVDNNARRLEVLCNCVNFIFDNKISEARIIFSAVLRALKCKVARLALTQELSHHIQTNRAMLEHQQFDLIVRLLNSALQNDSSMDENGVAAAILPLATTFCRKLCTGVIQFAYTCIQEHAVWANLHFWEAAFAQDVQKQIRQLYLPHYEEHLIVPSRNTYDHLSPSTREENKRRSKSTFVPREIGALEIAAEQLRTSPNLSEEERKEMISNEESTVYSQAIHYANRMVYMRVPLDCSKAMKSFSGLDVESNSNSNITASLAESDSFDAESGFDETEVSDVGATVMRFVTRFVDKVCNESGVTQDHIKALHQMIPGVVAMHIETLEAVHRESKRLPPIQKPKILTPTLLPGEDIIMDGLRVYLQPDGREEGIGGNMGGPSLLPAEGAIFLTTYRIIFKGTPCDPLACEQVVVRGLPVSTLTREKKIGVQYLLHLDQCLQEGLQIRASVFQLMKIAFDEEVSSDNVETFRKLVNKVRNPPSVFNTFAFTGQLLIQPTPLHKQKEKNASLKQFAKRTLLRTARKAGIKSKQSNRSKQKYILPTPPMSRRSMSPKSSDSESDRPSSEYYDDLSIIDESEFMTSLTADPKSVEKLMEKAGYMDFQRQSLASLPTSSQRGRAEPFRISTVNASFSVCRSYPALLIVPSSVTDDSIRKLARTHRQYRFPVVTWRHPRTKAVLLRASGFHSRGLMGMLKHNTSSGATSGETSSSLEQEKYFSTIVAATPNSSRMFDPSFSDSLTSLDSLMMVGTEGISVPETPDMLRKSSQYRSSGSSKTGSKIKTLGRVGSFREKSRMSTTSLEPGMLGRHGGMIDRRGDLINNSVKGLQRISLYVLGEKGQMKGIKMESFPRCDFIPVDFYEVRHIKTSFKKLMRACVPSTIQSAENTFYKAIGESEWLLQVQNVMQLAGATVDLLDVQGSSVMICLEDGWDVTAQVLCVAQILLDPFYRTIDGFKTLIEKEWLSFGHRFTHRSSQTAANQASGFAPIFLQFLDTVHQVHQQFPLSFEYNQYFLKFMAYHYVSNRFRTFMLDNEFERMEAGWLLEEKKAPKVADHEEDTGYSPKHLQSSHGSSIWDYIEKHHRKSPIFYNFMYSPEDQQAILRPYSNLANLRIWDYFLTEDLAHGPSYDIEVVNQEIIQNEEHEVIEGMGVERRKIINGCYDNIMRQQPDFFRWQLQEVHKLEIDLSHLPQKWKVFWDRLESPNREAVHRQISFNTQVIRSHGRSLHKRSTLEILVKGKMLGEAAKMFSQPHHFEKHTYTTPAYCDYCSHVLWGLLKTGMHCTDCGYDCHERCLTNVPKNCTKIKSVADTSASSSTLSKAGGSEASSSSAVGNLHGNGHMYEPYSSSGEHRTHEGYLYKRGALLKGWKQRWFVLDSMKHQLRYYDAMEDSNCKGFIDLSEVMSVVQIRNVPGALKKVDESAFFELKTMRRVYNFLASDSKSAQDWIDNIQSCIQ